MVQLADIYDYVTPCFPEKYRIFKVIFKEYHQHLSYMLDCIGACAEQLANSDILKVTLQHHSPIPICVWTRWALSITALAEFQYVRLLISA